MQACLEIIIMTNGQRKTMTALPGSQPAKGMLVYKEDDVIETRLAR
jgi:hypothetical protein